MMPTAKEFYDAHYSDDAVVIMRDYAKMLTDRMYSDEEVKQIIDATLIEYSDFVLADIPHWFEQFKKKQNEKDFN
jgi:hypothetical protein